MKKRIWPGDGKVLENLFVVMFGLCFAWMGTQMLQDIMALGVGEIYAHGVATFAVKALIVGLTFILSSIAFVNIVVFCNKIKCESTLVSYINVLIVMVLSASPWACYHIARIVTKPLAKDLYPWAGWLNNVDVIFIALYVPIVGIMLILGQSVKKFFLRDIHSN
jgi:hypothetical protein